MNTLHNFTRLEKLIYYPILLLTTSSAFLGTGQLIADISSKRLEILSFVQLAFLIFTSVLLWKLPKLSQKYPKGTLLFFRIWLLVWFVGLISLCLKFANYGRSKASEIQNKTIGQ